MPFRSHAVAERIESQLQGCNFSQVKDYMARHNPPLDHGHMATTFRVPRWAFSRWFKAKEQEEQTREIIRNISMAGHVCTGIINMAKFNNATPIEDQRCNTR